MFGVWTAWKKSIKVQATIEEGTGNDARIRKGTEGEGGSEYSWVSGSDSASMIGDVRSLQYEVWFEQPVWREEGEWVNEKKTWGRENRERGE